MDQYKFVILPALISLNSQRKAILEKYLLRNNRTILWTYATAINDGKRDTPEAMAKLTGFAFGTRERAEKSMGAWKSVFAPTSNDLTPEYLRRLAAEAGVHLFLKTPCPVWYDGRLLMVHNTTSGPQRIALRKTAKAQVLLGRPEALLQNDDDPVYDFDAPETILLKLD